MVKNGSMSGGFAQQSGHDFTIATKNEKLRQWTNQLMQWVNTLE